MQRLRIGLVALFVLISVNGGKVMSKTSSEHTNGILLKDAAPVQLGGFPFEVFPYREVFVTTEGEAFLVQLSVACPPGGANDSEFKLLDSVPNFVSLSAPLRGENTAVVLLVVNPQRGDAGTYEFKVSSKVCNGRTGDVTNFKVKVKKAKKGQ